PTRFSLFLRLWVLLRLDADDIVVGDLDRIPRLEFVATSPIDGQDHAERPVHPNDFAVPPVHGGDHGLPPTFKNQKWRAVSCHGEGEGSTRTAAARGNEANSLHRHRTGGPCARAPRLSRGDPWVRW